MCGLSSGARDPDMPGTGLSLAWLEPIGRSAANQSFLSWLSCFLIGLTLRSDGTVCMFLTSGLEHGFTKPYQLYRTIVIFDRSNMKA